MPAGDGSGGSAMWSSFSSFFESDGYIPHGLCLLWRPELIALHVGSDAAIALAYYSIPFALLYFVWNRVDLVFPRLFILTGIFILACGTTHVMSIVTLWQPDYRFEGVIKLLTAFVSVLTALVLWWDMPLALALPSTAQLEQANRSLAREITERERAQAELRDMNAELERRVAARTAELQEEVAHRRRSEAALQQSEMYLAEAQRVSRTGSFGWKVSDGEIFWSDETYRIFGCDRTVKPSLELILELAHPDDLPFLRRLAAQVAAEGKDWKTEYKLLLRDGSIKHVSVVAHAVKDSRGGLEFVGAVMDVTAARKAEQAIVENEQRWRQARSELSHVTRIATLGELTASITHEVNQPLAAISASGQAALRWLDQPVPEIGEAHVCLDRIVREARRANAVIMRTRELYKKSDPRKTPLDINEVIDDALSLVRREAASRHVSMHVELASGLPPVRGDRIQLQQVIINLVMNAIEAMADVTDRPTTLSVRSGLNESDQVVVSVQDVGPGIDPGNAEKLFNAFFTTKPNGMGMGLSICRSIIEAHEGHVWASANAGPGTTFQFRLPADRGMAADGSAPGR